MGQKLYVTATPDTDYKLETLSVNGSSIYESRSFTVELSTNYVISASFVSSVEAGEYSVTITGDRMVEVGNELQLTATVYGANKAVSYFMSDPDIARVNENGRVTALKAGFATVTATAVGSLSQDDPASASAWFYVVPSTMGKFIRQGQKGNLSKGIRYEGVLKYNIDRFMYVIKSDITAYYLNKSKNAIFGTRLSYLDYRIQKTIRKTYIFLLRIDLPMLSGFVLPFAFFAHSRGLGRCIVN